MRRNASLRSVPPWSRTVCTLPSGVLTRLALLASCIIFDNGYTSQCGVELAFPLGHVRCVRSRRKIRVFLVLLVSCIIFATDIRRNTVSALRFFRLCTFVHARQKIRRFLALLASALFLACGILTLISLPCAKVTVNKVDGEIARIHFNR